MDCHLSSFTITLKQGRDTLQLISLMVFRTDTWKRMVIRAIIISLVSGDAPAGRIQEDTSLMRFQKESSMITAIRQYRESSSVQSFLSTSADYRTRSTHLSREKPIVLKKKNRYSTRSGAGLTSRSHVRTAVKYDQNRKDTLMTYLEDGHCSFSNNLSENAIRPFTVGRKNWLFSATPKGATASALVYTMVEMAKANELNIYKYLTYLLEHRPSEAMSDEQLEELTPWSEEVQNVCKK